MSSQRKSKLLSLFLLLITWPVLGQDSTYVLTRDAFLSIVKKNHPTIKAANIQVRRAGSELLAARGGFDPSVTVDYEQKEFGGKPYYNYFNPELVIPTWYGVEFKAGLEDITGDRLDPEITKGQNSYVGVKVPATGLLFDKRRAVLRQAQQIVLMTEAERLLTVNDLLFDALADYWNWVKEYTVYTIVTDAVKVNEERLRFVKVEYEQGSRPAIDTTEALAQLQGFYLAQNAAYLAFRNAGLDLSNYLWADNQPYNWSMAIIPGTLTDSGNLPLPSLPDLIVLARNSHPKLQMLRNKTNILEIEKRLKMQYLMPKVSLKANYLNKGYAMPEQITTTLLENNYKVGLDLSMPLFFREARGAYQSAKFKITEIGLQQDQTTLNIENKVKMYFNEFYALRQQINIYEQVYSNNKTLFRGERTRFENGESTLFLLNSRENKLLEASQKLAELKAKWLKSYAAVIWATGDLK